MSSEINQLYERLLTSVPVTVSIPSLSDFHNLYAQLRTIKSRYDKKYLEAFDESMSGGRVIRHTAIPNVTDLIPDDGFTVTFSLGEKKARTKTRFTILKSEDDVVNG